MCNNILLIVLSYLLLSSLTIGLDEELQEGSACTVEDGGPGVCKKIGDCPQRMKEVEEGKRTWDAKGRCGFDGFIEIVCCPDKANIADKLGRRPAEIACSEYGDSLLYHIFDGVEAKAGEFPYMVALGYKNDQDAGEPIQYACGGSLISYEHVLTAAHCVHNINQNVPIEVRLGHEDVTSTDKNVQRIPISDIMYHPEYKLSMDYYDVAILKLKTKVKTSDTVKPICLQTKPLHSMTMTPNTSLVVVGWGATSFDEGLSNTLMKTPSLSLVSNQECSKFYSGFRKLPRGFDDTIICAIDKNVSRRSDACQGDSGGPLLMLSENGDSVVGITAFGRSCGTASPGVYMAVHSFLDWIEENVWSSPTAKTDDSFSFSFGLTLKSAESEK